MDLGQYVGIPFVDKGRDRSGLDCWGLLYLVYRDIFNVELPRYDDARSPQVDDIREVNRYIKTQMFRWEQVEKPEPGDGVLMREGRAITHIGIYVGSDRILHCERNTDTIIESSQGLNLKNRIVGYYRLKNEYASQH